MFKEFEYNVIDEIVNEEKIEYPLNFYVEKAEGAYLIEKNGKKYLDFTANFDNQPLGYSHLSEVQTNKLIYSGLFNSFSVKKLQREFFSLTGLEKSVFTSSKEGLYKLLDNLLRCNLNQTGKDKVLFIGNDKYKNIFPDLKAEFAPMNSDSIIKSIFTKDVRAVVVEVVRVDGDIICANTEYLKFLRELCDKNNAILVFDVASISPLRAGKTFLNYENVVKPDFILLSKGLNSEIPFGAMIFSKKFDSNFQMNFSIMAVEQAFEFIEKTKNPELQKVIDSNSTYLAKRLNDLLKKSKSLVSVDSYGMIFKLVINKSAFEFAKRCIRRGLIVEVINESAIKLTPPYIISKGDVDKFIFITSLVLNEL